MRNCRRGIAGASFSLRNTALTKRGAEYGGAGYEVSTGGRVIGAGPGHCPDRLVSKPALRRMLSGGAVGESNRARLTTWRELAGEFRIVDVGSRGGFSGLSLPYSLIHMVSIDADPATIPPPANFASFHHFPLALHSSEGEADLVVTARPSMSSLLEFDDAEFTRHFGLMPGSAAWKGYLAPLERRRTKVVRGDDFFRSQGLERIDLLKLDTQGTELEILRGCGQYLDSGRISVIKTEVSFLPVYKEQCVFAEIDHFLRQHGFEFVDCIFYPDGVNATSPEQAIRGATLREEVRFSAGGDAIYALRPEKYADDPARAAVRAAILLNQLGYVSFAFDLLMRCGHAKDFVQQTLQETAMNDRRARLKRLLKNHLSPWAYGKVLKLRHFIAGGS